MIGLIKAEMKKFKKSKIKYCTLVLFIPTIISFLMYAFNEKYDAVEWKSYFNIIITFLNYIVCSIVYGIITAHTIGSEYETRSINILFTYPINRIKILFSKLLFVFVIIVIALFSVFAISLGSGLIIEHEPITSGIVLCYLFAFVKMMFYHFMLISIVSAVTITTKSVLSSIIFIISVSFANLVVVNTSLSVFYPWSAPLLLSPHENVGRNFIAYNISFISLAVIFVVGLIISIRRYKYIQ